MNLVRLKSVHWLSSCEFFSAEGPLQPKTTQSVRPNVRSTSPIESASHADALFFVCIDQEWGESLKEIGPLVVETFIAAGWLVHLADLGRLCHEVSTSLMTKLPSLALT